MILSYPYIDPTIEEYDGSEIFLNLQLPWGWQANRAWVELQLFEIGWWKKQNLPHENY